MKKVYSTPSLRYIELENERGILEASVSFDSDDANAVDMEDEALSNKKNFWDREGIWK